MWESSERDGVGWKLGMVDYILINGDTEAGAFISRHITAEVLFFAAVVFFLFLADGLWLLKEKVIRNQLEFSKTVKISRKNISCQTDSVFLFFAFFFFPFFSWALLGF